METIMACVEMLHLTWHIETIRVESRQVHQAVAVLLCSSRWDFAVADLLQIWIFTEPKLQTHEIPPFHRRPQCQRSTLEHLKRTSSPSEGPWKNVHLKLLKQAQVRSTNVSDHCSHLWQCNAMVHLGQMILFKWSWVTLVTCAHDVFYNVIYDTGILGKNLKNGDI